MVFIKTFTLSFVLFVFYTPSSLLACDILGCIFNGHTQDTLILGEVVSVGTDNTKDLINVKISHVFPQNSLRKIKEDKEIVVSKRKVLQLSDEEENMISNGQKYLFSLNKRHSIFHSAFGFYEVKGESYSDMQIVKKKNMDDIILQLFINSGGVDTSFGVDYTNQEKPVLSRSLAFKDNNLDALSPIICEREIRNDRELLTFNRNLKKCH